MLRLYGDENLPAVERVCIFLEEKSLQFVVSPSTPAAEIAAETMDDNVLDGGPILISDNNNLIAGVTPICRYLEQLYPSPPMLGSTAIEQANVEMWQRYVENKVLSPLGVYFFHDKCIDDAEQLGHSGSTSWAEENRIALLDAYKRINLRLGEFPYISGREFTIADITMYSSLRFGQLIDVEIPQQCANLERWLDELICRFENPYRGVIDSMPYPAVMH